MLITTKMVKMTYIETVKYLYAKLPVFQKVGNSALHFGLDKIKALDHYLNTPHKNFRTIHIGGTNGKGSVAHILSSILQASGKKVGLYISPHITDFRERIKINGKMISKEDVIDFVTDNYIFVEQTKASFFEMTVAMAFDYFSKKKVDIAIIEVGLGGRLDSTNIIHPILSIITNISKDHTELLGDTLLKIAQEKAGIIKQNTPVVIGESQKETNKIFEDTAKKKNASITFTDKIYSLQKNTTTNTDFQSSNVYKNENLLYFDLKLDQMGEYQRKNLLTVLQSIEILNKLGMTISKEHIYSGCKNSHSNSNLKGRWQIIGKKPLIICDTGHNEAGIKYLVEQLMNTPHENLHIILGMVKDKLIENILKLFPKEAIYYFAKPNIVRALNENELQNKARKFNLKGEKYLTIEKALEIAKKNAENNDLIFITGSTFNLENLV